MSKEMEANKLDYLKLVKDINEVVDNDFGFHIDCKYGLDRPRGAEWTQEEADDMAKAILKVYTLSHCWYCSCAKSEYRLNQKEKQDGK